MIMNNSFFKILKRLFFVPVCASCHERLSPIVENTEITHGKACLCIDCAVNWHKEKAKMCRSCTKVASECVCTPKFFNKYQDHIPSVCFYSPDSTDAASNAILSAKRRNDRELFEFFALELRDSIKEMLPETETEPEKCIITWMPRSRASINKYNFDQGRSLAECVARELGIAAYPLFERRGGKEQKKLEKSERRENAERSTVLNKRLKGIKKGLFEDISDLVREKTVIVLDDVITSGATMKRGFLLLSPLKPKKIFAVTLAKTELKAKKINQLFK
jgi:predicted amidophosphoribosyltransferase